MKLNGLIKAVIMISMAILCTSVYGQEEKGMAVGANISFGLDEYDNIGLTAKFQWNSIGSFRVEPSVSYYFEKSDLEMWFTNINVHYLLKLTHIFTLYPLAGIAVAGEKNNSTDHFGISFGANLGAGVEFNIIRNFVIGAEFKYQFISNWQRPVLSAGVAYRF